MSLADPASASSSPAPVPGTGTGPLPPFEVVVTDHFDAIWATLRRLGVPDADRQDVAQEVLLTAHRRRQTYDPSRPLRPWILGISARVASDYRRLARHRHELADPAPEVPAPQPGPDRSLEVVEAQRLVIAALDGVGELRRTVFVLHDIEELPMSEVAELLDIPLHTGYSRLRKAREEFAAAVSRLGGPRRST